MAAARLRGSGGASTSKGTHGGRRTARARARGAQRAVSPPETAARRGVGYEPPPDRVAEARRSGLTGEEAGELRAAAARVARRVLERERVGVVDAELDAAVAECVRDFEARLLGWLGDAAEAPGRGTGGGGGAAAGGSERNDSGGVNGAAAREAAPVVDDAAAAAGGEEDGGDAAAGFLYYRRRCPLSMSPGVGDGPRAAGAEAVADLTVAMRSRLSDCQREAVYEVDFRVDFRPEFVSAAPAPPELQLHWNVSNCSPSAEHFRQIQCASTRRRKVVPFVDSAEDGAGAGEDDACPVLYDDDDARTSRWADVAEGDATRCDELGCETGLFPPAGASPTARAPGVYTASVAVSPDADMHAINFMLHSREDAEGARGHWLLPLEPRPERAGPGGGGASAVGHTVPLPLSMFHEIVSRRGARGGHGVFPLGRESASGHLLAVHEPDPGGGGGVDVFFVADAAKPLVVHWAFYSDGDAWVVPGAARTPPGSLSTDRFSETPLGRMSSGALDRLCPAGAGGAAAARPLASGLRLQCAHLRFDRAALAGVHGLEFVVRTDDGGSWYKDAWRNFRFGVVRTPGDAGSADGADGAG